MERKEIIERLKKIIKVTAACAAKLDNVEESSRLQEDLGLSSVGMLYSVIGIEEEFNILFDDVELDSFKTVADIVDYINAKL